MLTLRLPIPVMTVERPRITYQLDLQHLQVCSVTSGCHSTRDRRTAASARVPFRSQDTMTMDSYILAYIIGLHAMTAYRDSRHF